VEQKNNNLDYLKGLNSQQAEAATTTEGPVLIIAGAGAGKTKTLTHRILNLIKSGTPADQILAITFTNKAAKEMRDRVGHLLGQDLSLSFPGSYTSARPLICTFHSLGVKIIKDNAKYFGLTKNFTIFDRSDSLRVIKEILHELDLDSKLFEPGKILNIISREKGELVTARDYSEKSNSINGYTVAGVTIRVWARYEEKLAEEKALDFDDLLLKTYLLLKNQPAVLEHYQNTWHYVHIDEYQDTNRVQYMTAKLLVGERKNICVVGDVDQNIYSWRGANIQNLLRFEKDYPGAKIIKLEENYRSTQNIISAANQIIAKNTIRVDKTLFTKKEEGEKITIFEATNEVEEARYIARTAKSLIEAGTPAQEIVALYRANFQSRVLEEAMLAESVPYQLLGTKFFERKEVKDVLSFIRASLNPDSLGDLKRIINVPARGLGKVTILKIFSGQKDDLPASTRQKVDDFYKLLEQIRQKIETEKPTEVVKFIITASGLEKELLDGSEDDKERLENMKELATLAKKYEHWPLGEGIEKMLEEAALASDQDDLEKNEKAIKLMTVHAAKGLEFDCVFVTGLEEDLFPHQRLGGSRRTKEEDEEERRLFYVALTRARKKLYLTFASLRTIFGSQIVNSPSQFLEDISEDLVEKEENFEYREKIIYLDL
jgi:DNA helicase-2/ATP-dependent DNA helicase PcrA